jgi:coproporphyrinogen III oxidase
VGEEFSPRAFSDWFQERMKDWARQTGHAPATPHAFRKTALQHARSGEDLNRQVARDARLSESVMMAHYVTERDEEMRQASNRTYHRILLSLSLEVATRYGYQPDDEAAELERRLAMATAAKDWETVAKLATELARRNGKTAGTSGNGRPSAEAP